MAESVPNPNRYCCSVVWCGCFWSECRSGGGGERGRGGEVDGYSPTSQYSLPWLPSGMCYILPSLSSTSSPRSPPSPSSPSLIPLLQACSSPLIVPFCPFSPPLFLSLGWIPTLKSFLITPNYLLDPDQLLSLISSLFFLIPPDSLAPFISTS